MLQYHARYNKPSTLQISRTAQVCLCNMCSFVNLRDPLNKFRNLLCFYKPHESHKTQNSVMYYALSSIQMCLAAVEVKGHLAGGRHEPLWRGRWCGERAVSEALLPECSSPPSVAGTAAGSQPGRQGRREGGREQRETDFVAFTSPRCIYILYTQLAFWIPLYRNTWINMVL